MPAFSSRATAVRPVLVPPALQLPVVERDFTRRLHNYWPKLQVKSKLWLQEKRLMSPAAAEALADELRYTDLVAGYYLGASEAMLGAIADFSSWFFAWDDRHDRDVAHARTASWRGLCADLHATLRDPGAHLHHEEPLVAAFADCLLRMGEPMPTTWRDRFARHMSPVIDAYDHEFGNRLSRTVPTVAAYLELRRLTFGHELWLDLLEAVAGTELPAAVRESPAYRTAGLACQDFSAWYNDLCSLPKEIAGDELHNLGISLIRHEGMELAEAVSVVREKVAGRVTAFLAAEKELRALADSLAEDDDDGEGAGKESTRAALISCTDNMRNWFPSVYWFHHESGRYRVEQWDDPACPPYLQDGAPARTTPAARPAEAPRVGRQRGPHEGEGTV
ncbi:terpene synthase family protein [Streptomyces sp. CH6]|uniref:terpene synthase family protein n=1 Tax=Streptomyces sp. CH6 TaxID=3420320 RepID=UPI003D03B5C8